MAVSAGEMSEEEYAGVSFGKNYPDDDNMYCMVCMDQSDCIKLSKVN